MAISMRRQRDTSAEEVALVLGRLRVVLNRCLELGRNPCLLEDPLQLLRLGDVLGQRDLDEPRHGTGSVSRSGTSPRSSSTSGAPASR